MTESKPFCISKWGGSTIFLSLEEKWYRRGDMLLGCRQFIVQDPDGYLLRLSRSIGSKPVGSMSGGTADDRKFWFARIASSGIAAQ
jgi:hypothetical protein